jgi:hypothetical protein
MVKSLHITLLSSALLLAACSNSPKGVRIENGGTSAYSDKPGAPIRNLTAPEIGSAIIGKTFQYTRKSGSGFVTYNTDGTFSFQDDQQGEGTGQWVATGDQFCETYGANGTKECGIFKSTGDAFFAANSRLVEMKV